MPNEISSGNDNLTKECFEKFWTEVKKHFDIVFYTLLVRNNSVLLIDKQLQNQLRKRQRQRLIQNWRPIFLLNIDFKIISKALSKRLENVLSSLFSDNQSAYVDGRFRWIANHCYATIRWYGWYSKSFWFS